MARITLQSEPGSIEIEFQLTWAEKRLASRTLLSAFRKKLGLDRKWRQLVWLCAGVVLAAMMAAWLAGVSATGLIAIVLAGSAAPIGLAGALFLQRLEHKRIGPLRSKRALRQNWRLGPEGMDVTFGKSRLHLAWSDLRNVHHVPGLSLVFLDETQYLIVPDRAFVSRGQRRRFLAYLKVALEVSHPKKRFVAKAA